MYFKNPESAVRITTQEKNRCPHSSLRENKGFVHPERKKEKQQSIVILGISIHAQEFPVVLPLKRQFCLLGKHVNYSRRAGEFPEAMASVGP